MMNMKNGEDEMPPDFDNEIHKWALECIKSKVYFSTYATLIFRHW
jgi:hypothetical protein